MVQAVIPKIISMQNNFTVGENEIAQYIMKHADVIVTSTITTIAKNTGTSEASVNRFFKKIGFKGFNSFKVALAQETFYSTMNRNEINHENDSFISSISRDYRQMLRNTSALLDENIIISAVDAMKNSTNVYIFSHSSNSLVAKEAEYKLCLAGIHAKAVIDTADMYICAANVQKTDFVIFIVTTVLMREIYKALTTCHDHDAKILTITSYDSPKLDILVDFKIITSDKITAENSISISNNMIYLFVLDVIYRYLLERDKSLKKKKLSNEALLQNSQILDNYLLDY